MEVVAVLHRPSGIFADCSCRGSTHLGPHNNLHTVDCKPPPMQSIHQCYPSMLWCLTDYMHLYHNSSLGGGEVVAESMQQELWEESRYRMMLRWPRRLAICYHYLVGNSVLDVPCCEI